MQPLQKAAYHRNHSIEKSKEQREHPAPNLLPSLHVIEKDAVLALYYNWNTDQ